MSLCRSQFFFIKNSSILSVGAKNGVSPPAISLLLKPAPKKGHFSSLNYISSLFSQSIQQKPQQQIINRALSFTPNNNISIIKPSNFVKRTSPLSKQNQTRSFCTTPSVLEENLTTKKGQLKTPLNQKWPINSHKNVGYLCIGSSILVFAIVILGGLTRLTESGLSITEWKPVTGSIPPLTEEDWEIEFNKYKDSPEFKLLNSHITLEEFKFIFSMEWSHRLLGRIIGAVFIVPTLYYIARKKVSKPMAAKLLGICALIGLQGAIGWWMVYSGIDEQLLEERKSKPTVSQYRLAAHLGAAFLVYCAMISTGVSVLRDHAVIKAPEQYLKIFQQIQSPSLQKFRKLSTALLGLVFLTAMSGALVAGLDAGLIYNTFPHMGDDYIPSCNELLSPVYSRLADQSDLWWRNCLENPTMVQLEHRILATTTFFSVVALHMYSHRIKTIIPRAASKWLGVAMGLVTVQVGLGISTLIYLVPTELAAAHQGGALALLTSVLMVWNCLRKPTRANLVLLKNSLSKVSKNGVKNSQVLMK